MSTPSPFDRKTTLPTADRLARGDEARYLFGKQQPHKLQPAEWPIYEAAKQNGYLVVSGAGLARRRLRNCYWAYCRDLGRPFVVAELRKRYASVELDMIEIPPRANDTQSVAWKLSDRAYWQINGLLGEVARPGSNWSSGHIFAYAYFVPIELAPWLAERLFTIACADLRGAHHG